MTIIKAFIKNFIVSNLWSVILGIICIGLCADLVENDAAFAVFICWIINTVISFLIHLFLFSPGILIYRNYHQEYHIIQAFQSLYPLLLIPLAFYFFIMSVIISDISSAPNSFGLTVFAGISLMLMHSISLYTFIYLNFKNENHAEINS